jgi:hypothetical protein
METPVEVVSFKRDEFEKWRYEANRWWRGLKSHIQEAHKCEQKSSPPPLPMIHVTVDETNLRRVVEWVLTDIKYTPPEDVPNKIGNWFMKLKGALDG